ncbi:MAG: MmgE/PrpD family protein [Gemmatimonadetes bacterium]|nr:MmgE/PrpD family protein [Gemmatimonadota bacterium]
MSLTADLVQSVWEKPVREEDLTTAAAYVLDALACAVGGRFTRAGRILSDWADERGSGLLTDASRVAGLVHVLEMDDLHRESVTHPGCVVVPAAWAVATAYGKSGRELLTAVLRGYEVMARIGASVGPDHYKIWHNTATCGPFGSAAAAGSLWGLDKERMVWALGNAGTQASGLWQFLEEGAMSKHLHAAHAAEAGVTSAALGRRGFSGPARILEGDRGFYRAMCPDPDPGRLEADPEAPWELVLTSIKPWPSCRHTHPAVDAGLELHSAVGDRPVGRIGIETYDAALALCDRARPTSEYEAKFSLQYCVAVAVRSGQVDLRAFGEEERRVYVESPPEVEVFATQEFREAYPDRWGARVTVELESGERVSAEREACLGDPEAPLGSEGLWDKALGLLVHGSMSPDGARAFAHAVQALPEAPLVPPFPV